ncbi:MAG: hypothetical protein ABJA84_09265 [Polaromonas sp.]
MRELLDIESRTDPCPACGAQKIVRGFGPACAICGSQLIRLSDVYLKHTGSWLLDLPVRVSYDDESRTVTLSAQEFDSGLISDFVIRHLSHSGIIAYTDETGEIQSPQAPWRLVFELSGVRYRLHVVKQIMYGSSGKTRVAARLIPIE